MVFQHCKTMYMYINHCIQNKRKSIDNENGKYCDLGDWLWWRASSVIEKTRLFTRYIESETKWRRKPSRYQTPNETKHTKTVNVRTMTSMHVLHRQLRWYLTLQGGNSILTYRDQWSFFKSSLQFQAFSWHRCTMFTKRTLYWWDLMIVLHF